MSTAAAESMFQSAELYDLVHDVNDVLDEAGINRAIMSGLHAVALQEAATGVPHRVTQDGDFWLPDADIDRAAEILDANTSHGFGVSYFRGTDRSIITVSRDAEVELMANMDVATTSGVFAFRMTPTVLSRACAGLGNWHVPFVDPVDSIILKALLQRSEGKHDAVDIQAMSFCGRIDRAYLWDRLDEINDKTQELSLPGTGVEMRVIPYLGIIGTLGEAAHAS
ncbi:MAG: hypothetical protein ACQR33_00315 [Candidatus Saccharibacteria bacterium]